MSQCESDEVYHKIIDYLREYKNHEINDKNYCRTNINTFEAYDNNSYKLTCNYKHEYFKHTDENEKLGANLILEIFEIFRNSHIFIIQNLSNENIKLNNDLRISQNFISNLEKKSTLFMEALSKESLKNQYDKEGELKVSQHPSRENCLEVHENLE
jgi:hypothetical protein